MATDWRKSSKPADRRVDCVICKAAIMVNENYCWAPNPQGPGYIRAHTACVEHQDPGARKLEDILENIVDEFVIMRELFERVVIAIEKQNPPEAHP